MIFLQCFIDDQSRKMPEVKDDATQTPMRPRVGPNVHFKVSLCWIKMFHVTLKF